MNQKDELTTLFRQRLSESQLEVRPELWQDISQDINTTVRCRRRYLVRFSAAASVLLAMMGASAAFLFFTPKSEISQAFTQVETVSGGAIQHRDGVEPAFSTLAQTNNGSQTRVVIPSAMVSSMSHAADSSMVSFSFSLTVRKRGKIQYASADQYYRQLCQTKVDTEETTDLAEVESSIIDVKSPQPKQTKKRWSVGLQVGTGLPTAHQQEVRHQLPISAGLTIGKQITEKLMLESGVNYTNLQSTNNNLHYLGIPLKASLTLVEKKGLDLYATGGVMVEKCVGGEAKSDPLQLSLSLGAGARYRLNDRLAMFVEPSLAHYIDNGGDVASLRSEKRFSMNVMAGVKLNF